MTTYFSIGFLCLFLPAVIIAYCIAPQRLRWCVLLGASYAFFWSISGKLIVFVLISTLSIYLTGHCIARLIAVRTAAIQDNPDARRELKKKFGRRMKAILAVSIALNLGMLAAIKYLPFFASLGTSLLQIIGINIDIAVPKFAAPIGISFYTLMAISYLIDVFRGTIPAERHLGRVALFLAFFPQIMEGPLARFGDVGPKLGAGTPITWDNLHAGTIRILWGLAKKLLIADRLNAFVKPVFDDYASFDGTIIALAAVFYTLQLYCDFSGTIDVALGTARIFGISLPENFRQPFFSRTASEFWQRWHITLGAWFRDYVYYPLSLSKPLKKLTSRARRRLGNRMGPLAVSSIALLSVWVGNGLWHGAGSQYLFFGMYYFAIILVGGFVELAVQPLARRLGINRDALPYRIFQITRTLLVVFVGELFFRAQGLHAGLAMFTQIMTSFSGSTSKIVDVRAIGMDGYDFIVVGVFSLVILIVGIAKEKGIDPLGIVQGRLALRWSVPLGLLMCVVIFGAYGNGYVPLDPIYAQF